MKTRNCTSNDQSRRSGMTLIELILVVVVLLVLVALLLPPVRRSREAARRSQCKNNLKQLCVGLHNYHDVHRCFPSAMGGTDGGDQNESNQNRLSGFVGLLPFIDEGPLWKKISAPIGLNETGYPPMGPAPWVGKYEPWRKQLYQLWCASNESTAESQFGKTSYAFCIGDMAHDIHRPETVRGAFACGQTTRLEDVRDGNSQTIALAEIGNRYGSMLTGQFAINQSKSLLKNPNAVLKLRHMSERLEYIEDVPLSRFGRGGCWADGAGGVGLVNTILPPNSPSVSTGENLPSDGFYSAGSPHPGGIHVGMVDGSVRFVRDNIDVGDLDRPTLTTKQLCEKRVPSPYGVWGALGTAAAGEEVNEF